VPEHVDPLAHLELRRALPLGGERVALIGDPEQVAPDSWAVRRGWLASRKRLARFRLEPASRRPAAQLVEQRAATVEVLEAALGDAEPLRFRLGFRFRMVEVDE
jgi:hypothetical protein